MYVNRAALWCGGGGLRAGACVVLQVAAEGEVQGQAARQLFVAVGQQGFFDATGRVFFVQHVLQARRARLVADAGEAFDVFCLGEAVLQVARFVLALFEVEDGVLGFAEGAVEGLPVVGEVLLVVGFCLAARQFFFVRVEKRQGDVGGDGANGVVQEFEQAVGAGAEVGAEGEVGVLVAFGDGDVAEVLL